MGATTAPASLFRQRIRVGAIPRTTGVSRKASEIRSRRHDSRQARSGTHDASFPVGSGAARRCRSGRRCLLQDRARPLLFPTKGIPVMESVNRFLRQFPSRSRLRAASMREGSGPLRLMSMCGALQRRRPIVRSKNVRSSGDVKRRAAAVPRERISCCDKHHRNRRSSMKTSNARLTGRSHARIHPQPRNIGVRAARHNPVVQPPFRHDRAGRRQYRFQVERCGEAGREGFLFCSSSECRQCRR